MLDRRTATVLMLDVVGSTQIAAELGDARYRGLSARFDRVVRTSIRRFGGREQDHAGDGFFVTFPEPDRAIRCAAAIAEGVRGLGIEIRCGIHTGQTGSQGGKAQGTAVVVGARVMSLAEGGVILVTSTTRELVAGGDFAFDDPSVCELKGLPGAWQVSAVTAVDGKQLTEPLPATEAAHQRAAIGPSGRTERRTTRVLGAVGAIATLAVIGVAVAFLDGSDEPQRKQRGSLVPATGSVVQLDAKTGEQISAINARTHAPTGTATPPVTPHGMVVGQGGVWIVRFPRFLIHVDPLDRDVRATVSLDGAISFSINVAEGAGDIWVAHFAGLVNVNPATDEQRLVVDLTDGLEGLGGSDVAFGFGRVWLGSGNPRLLLRFDPRTGRERSNEDVLPIDQIEVGHGAVWTVSTFDSIISRFDPDTMQEVAAIPVDSVDGLAVGDEHLWALSRATALLTQIDPDTNTTGRSVQVGESPTAVATGLGAIWVADEDGSIRRIDEDTLAVTVIPFGAEIRAMAFDEESDALWVDVA